MRGDKKHLEQAPCLIRGEHHFAWQPCPAGPISACKWMPGRLIPLGIECPEHEVQRDTRVKGEEIEGDRRILWGRNDGVKIKYGKIGGFSGYFTPGIGNLTEINLGTKISK